MAQPLKPLPYSTFNVIAPSNLEGGYEFVADNGNGESYLVRVPAEGVKEGQQFEAAIVSITSVGSDPHNIPIGRWRDGLCDCCQLGCCHPLLCLTYWCRFCALGQLLTRMNLTWRGSVNRKGSYPTTSAFKILFGIGLAFAIGEFIIGYLQQIYGMTEVITVSVDAYGEAITRTVVTYPAWLNAVNNATSLSSVLLLFVLTMRLRSFVRSKYNIPEKTCNGCEDCCCSFWCSACTLCQIGRHTADYNKYPAGCCTENGLTAGAPEVV